MAIAFAAMLATPASIATWSAMGGMEPDNAFDSATYNFQDAPGAITDRVYFQVFQTTQGLNPNVGTPDGSTWTANEAVGTTSVYALLGVWRDCNGDGYIGIAESATLEYPSQLLDPANPICPPVTGAPTDYATHGHPSNYNGWVTEFIHIGGSGGDVADDVNDTRIIRDSAAMVWGDFGRPDDTTAASGGTCALTPLPRGTLQTTGGAINYFDCIANSRGGGVYENWNWIFTGRTLAGQRIPGIDEGNSLGLLWENDDDGRVGNHPLQRETLGSEDSAGAVVSFGDCQDVLFDSGETINATGVEGVAGRDLGPAADNVTIFVPDPAPTGTSAPTIPGQVNETFEDLDGDCDTSNDNGGDTYGQLEGDFSGTTQLPTGKTQAEWTFGFNDFVRSGYPHRLLSGQTTPPIEGGDPTGPSAFSGAFRVSVVFFAGPVWDGNAGVVRQPSLIRANFETGDVGPANRRYETFYAFVGGNTTSKGFALPGGGATTNYGAAQCPVLGVPFDPANPGSGWNCDPTTWYMNTDGTPRPNPTDSGGFARVGQPYHLRDVDCYDGATSAGIPLAVASLAGVPCDR